MNRDYRLKWEKDPTKGCSSEGIQRLRNKERANG